MIKRLLPVGIILVVGVVSYFIMQNPPSQARGNPQRIANLNVEVETLNTKDYTVVIESYGKLYPRTESELLPQVAGQITWVSEQFRAGGFFEEGDELIRIDDRDYVAQLATQEATLMSANQTLSEEQARSEQALADWKRLGNNGKAPALVARLPQVKAAQASLASAKAGVAQAKLNVERTHIRAPYAGRVLEKNVGIGQVVSSNSSLATLYAVDFIEVRLPIQARDLPYIDLPERYRFSDKKLDNLPKVTLSSELIRHQDWQGEVVMTEGAIDEASRQLYVVAQIDDPYGAQAEGKIPLKIGQYVQAHIQGKVIENALVIPNRVIYQGSYVYVLSEGLLQRREIEIAWQNESEAVIQSGLVASDVLVTTALGQVISGTPAAVKGSAESGNRPDKVQGNRERAEKAATPTPGASS